MNRFAIIVGGCDVPSLYSTLGAFMKNALSAISFFKSERFHHPHTGIFTITGMNVDMPAPKAVAAVVGVSIALNDLPTVEASKVFNSSLK